MKLLRAVPLLALASCALSASAQNIVKNGSFENASPDGVFPRFSDWTGSSVLWSESLASEGAHSACFFVPSTLSQTLATQAGQSYTLSFDLYRQNSNTDAFPFSASFGGVAAFAPASLVPSAFVHYSLTVLAASSSTELVFTNRDRTMFLDNVSVVANTSAVPGPMAALPFALMALRHHRRA